MPSAPASVSEQADRLVVYGLQQHTARRVLGLAVRKDLTPLLSASYTLLANRLTNGGRRATSLLQQLGLTYSLGNESDLLFSLTWAGGQGLDALGRPRSEFGHLPMGITARWRMYF